MTTGVTFAIYVLLVSGWMLAWGALGAVVSNSRNESGLHGLVQGILLGPIGVLLIALFFPKTEAIDDARSLLTPERLINEDDLYR